MENYDDFFDRLKNYEYVPPAKATPAPKKESNWEATKRIAGDLGPSFGSGSGQLVRSVGTLLAGSDSGMAGVGQDAVDYWDAKKSAQLKTAEQDLGADMANPNVGAWDVTKKLVTSPTLLTNAIAGSAPSMAAGMGAGGLIARSMAGAGVMVDAAGGLTRLGSTVASGTGEGLAMAPDVYESTGGNGYASAAALALGIVTNMVTPGNIGAAAARRITGTADDAVRTAFNSTAVRRAGGAIAAEAGQEYGQEFGQKLVEQAGRGEDFDLNAANKAGAIGAVVGGVMGGGLHPIVGDGAPRYATQADKDVAVGAEVAAIKLGDINKALEADPNNPVLLAEASLAQATINRAAPGGNTEVLIAQQTAAAARLEAERNPGNQDLNDQADHATAAAALLTAGPDGIAPAANQAHAAAVETIHAAPDIDAAASAFAAGEQASATLRTTVTGIERTHAGVAVAGQEVLASHTATAEQLAKFEKEALAEQQKQEQHALKVEQQRIKNQTAAVKLQQEIAKARGEEITIEAPATGADELWDNQLAQPPAEVMLTGDQVRELMAQPDGIMDEFDLTEPEGVSPELAEATRAMVDEGYSQAVIEQQEQAPTSSLRVVMNSLDATYNRRRHAFEVLQTHDEGAGLTRAQFNAREAELDRQLRANLPSTSHGNAHTLARQVGSRPLASLRAVAAGNQVESGLARVAAAFVSGRHLGNVDEVLVAPTATTPARSTTSLPSPDDRYIVQYYPDGRTADVVDQSGEVFDTYRGPAAEQDAEATAQRLNSRPASVPAPRTRAQALADEMRSAAAEVDSEPATGDPAIVRSVTSDFRNRANNALRDGTLEKLGQFWKTVMSGRGQRVLNVATSDLAQRATSIRDLSQRDLNTLRDRYNRELKRQAQEWATANNQPAPSTQNPVIEITNQSGRGRGVVIRIRPLGRNGANPYAVPPGNVSIGAASVDAHDGHMTTVGLEEAAGSSDLAYRIGAEVARIAGVNVPASGVLLTNNPMRRQMQSVFADTLFGPGHVSPISSGGSMTPQGVPSGVWNDAGQVERIGLNAMRAAHSVTENRQQSQTAAKFLENLQFTRNGEIVAATAPLHSQGFAKGTVVTDEALLAKLLDRRTTGSSASGRQVEGGVGLDTAKFAIMNNTVLAKIEGNREANIPTWMATKAKQIGREMGGWMFSQGGQTTGTPISREDATTRVNALLGDSVGKVMLESGMISFVDTAAELTGDTFSDAGGRVRGATSPDGSIVMVLENLTAENFDAVLQHEGLHSTLKALVGEETYGKLMARLDTMLKSGKGSDWAAAANARVPANTAEVNRLEEVAAYALELPVDESSNPLVQWGRDFMSAIRAAIIKSKRVPEALRIWAIKNLQVEDLRKLALAGLRSQAVAAQEGTRLSAVSIDTPAFKRWFGDSKVVDSDGKPLVVYHGTPDSFSPDGNLWFTSSPNAASNYAANDTDGEFKEGANIIPAYIHMENPLVINADGASYDDINFDGDSWISDDLADEARRRGHDGLILKNVRDAGDNNTIVDVFHVLHGRQIKSAIGNNGAFDPNNPDIRRSAGRDYQGEIDSLMAEHAMPETTNERRTEINTELGKVRTAQRVEQDSDFEAGRRSEGASYGTPRDGATAVQAVHFSGAQRSTLTTSAYGTGIKGEEAIRLNDPANADIKPRTHFYVDEGKGITREQGVGSVGHTVMLNNLYDTKADKLGLVKGDKSKMERAIKDAGFDGYYVPNYRDMGQGVAVVIGEHTIPTEPYVEGRTATNTAPAATTDSFAANLRKSTLPAGKMSGREWAVAVRGTEFDTPSVRIALNERPDETFYRDDLPRLNRGVRLSIAQEVTASTEPVQQPHPRELNVAGLNWRKPLERIFEHMRITYQDKHATIRRIQQLAGVAIEDIRINTVAALDRLGSRLMTKQQDLVLKPMAQIEHLLNKAGYSGEEGRKAIDELLVAMHVAEYNAHIATINPARYEMKDGVRTYVSGHDAEHPGSGITDKEAKATLRRLTGASITSPNYGKVTALLAARRVYRQMITDLQNYAVEQGLEKQETIDTWNEKFPNYAPFNRDLDLDEDLSIGTVPGSQGFSLRTGIARRAMGSGADIISPLASTVAFGLKTTTRGENAEVSRTVLNFAREFVPNYLSNEKGPDGKRVWKPMWKVETVPSQRVVRKLNVYRTKMADGEMSPEFYNRAQARDYADYQQSMWVQMNPNADPNTSGISVQQVGEGPQNRVVIQPTPMPMSLSNVMVIPEEGENRIVTFDEHSEDAMAILHGMKGTATSGANAKEISRMLTLPRMFSRWVMATSTGFNPVFSLFNAARDVPGAMLSVGSDKIPGWTAADSAAIGKNFFKAAGSIWKQKGREFKALHSNNGAAPAPAPDSYAHWADEMQAYGGATGVSQSANDIDSIETTVRRLFGQELVEKTTSPNKASDWLSKAGGVVVKVGDAFARFGEGETKLMGVGWVSRNIVSATARLNEAAELATRTAVFKAATEKFMAAGNSEAEAKTMAAVISKNVSTNFNRRGTASSTINQLFPFFNASMQGSARLAESLFEKQTFTVDKEGRVAVDQKTKLTPYGKVIAASLIGIGGLQAALLAMAGFEDDDIQKNIKDRAFIVPLSGGSYIAIPMPHGFNTIVNFGREMTDAVIHPEKAATHVGNALWQAPAFNPLGSAGNVVTDFLPAIVDAPVSLYMNQDAFGRPIAKEDGDKANPTPGFTRAKEGASKFGRVMSELLNTVTGGNEDQKGALSPTPDQIDFAMGVVGGGVGRETMKAGQLIGAGVDAALGNEREPIPTYKLPLIGRLYGDINEPVALRGKVFEIRKDLNDSFARYKGLKDRGETDAANSYWDEHPELALRDDFERFSKNDSKQKKARALARNSDEVSEVNRITNEQDSKVSDLLDRYRELKAK